MPAELATYSLIAAYSAAAVYLIAFIAFTVDLGARSERGLAERDAREVAAPAAPARASTLTTASGVTTVLERTSAPGSGGDVPVRSRAASRWERVGFALAVIGWLVNLGAVVLRGVAAGRVPWANMFEFTLTGTAIIVGVFLVVQVWRDLRFLGAFVTGMAVVFLTVGSVNFYVDVAPLSPPLKSAWLVIHVLVAILGTGFYAIGAGLSIVQLLQARREAGRAQGLRFLQTLPGSAVLEGLAYRVIVIGFTFWTATLIFGAIWAERAWGRYWGWDTKEVWTFVIWVVFAGYIHARATRGWRGSRAATLAIIGFGAVLFNFTIVNLFFKGLHVYSGL